MTVLSLRETRLREACLKWAKEAGCYGASEDDLERFAALVAAAEREECAKVCESIRYKGYVPPEDGAAADYYNDASIECAAAIRSRSNKGSN